jgi:Dolichyl-phosphate-mannose-protein mannosyltransferase
MPEEVAPVRQSSDAGVPPLREPARPSPWGLLERSARVRYAIIAALLLVLLLQATGTLLKSPTCDEPRYLGLGLYLVEHHKWDIEDTLAHPPLNYYLSGIALSALHIPDSVWSIPNSIQRGQAIIRLYPNDLVIRLARFPIMFLSLLMGFYVYRWASDLYGIRAGILGLAVFCLNPVITSFAAIANGDTAIAAFTLIATYYWWRFNVNANRRNLILTGISFGLALLSKYSAPMLLPVFVLTGLATIYHRRHAIVLTETPLASAATKASDTEPRAAQPKDLRWMVRSLVFITLIGLLVAWAGYGFETGFASDPSKRPHHTLDKLFGKHPGLHHATYVIAEHIPVPMPSMLKGMSFMYFTSKEWTTRTFLMGKYSNKGFWDYHIVGLALKTPLGTLLLLLLSVIFWRKLKANWRDELFLIIPFACLLGYYSLLTTIQVGIRFILPVIPFAYIFLAKSANLPKIWNRRFSNIAIAVCVLWTAFSAIRIYPDNLAYFNELAGGPDNGYKWMVDSNLDWGQDLIGLKRYMDDHHIQKIKLAYFGTPEPEYYGIDYDYLPSSIVDLGWSFRQKSHPAVPIQLPTTGLIAVSVTELEGPYFPDTNEYAWLKQYQPIARVGHTIFIYDIK